MKTVKMLVGMFMLVIASLVIFTVGCKGQMTPMNPHVKQAGDWPTLESATYDRLATSVLRDKAAEARDWSQTIVNEQVAEVKEITEVIPARASAPQQLTKAQFDRAYADAERAAGWFNFSYKSTLRGLANKWRRATTLEDAEQAVAAIQLLSGHKYQEAILASTNAWYSPARVFQWNTTDVKSEKAVVDFTAAVAAEHAAKDKNKK